MPFAIPSCRHRADTDSRLFRCRHPHVVSPSGFITADTCHGCRRREEPVPQRPRATVNGNGAPSAMIVPRGQRPVYRCDVVVPYHHNLQWVPQAIDSILWQQSVECTLHLVNDHSPEDDAWLRRAYAGRPNLIWYRNRQNVGPYASVHQIWRHMRTGWLAIQDSDDVALPNRLWYSIHALEESGAEIFGGAMEQFLDPSVPEEDEWNRHYVAQMPFHRSGLVSRTTPRGNVIHGTMVVRRACFERLGGYAAYHNCSCDIEFITRAHYAGAAVHVSGAVVALRQVSSDSLSRGGTYRMGTPARQAMLEEWERRYCEFEQSRPFDPRRYGGLAHADESLTERIAADD